MSFFLLFLVVFCSSLSCKWPARVCYPWNVFLIKANFRALHPIVCWADSGYDSLGNADCAGYVRRGDVLLWHVLNQRTVATKEGYLSAGIMF